MFMEDNIHGWDEPAADAAAVGDGSWGPVDDGSGWGGNVDDHRPVGAAADQPQKGAPVTLHCMCQPKTHSSRARSWFLGAEGPSWLCSVNILASWL